MPEHIPELDLFMTEAEGVAMLPASEVRRRGDRRRTKRRSGIAAGALALLLTAGFGIWKLPLLHGTGGTAIPGAATPSPAPSGTGTTTAPAPDPTAPSSETETTGPPGSSAPAQPGRPSISFDLLPPAEALWGPDAPGEIKQEYDGLGQAAKGLCDPGDIGQPTKIVTREYGAKGGYPASQWVLLAEYGSARDATVGFDAIRDAAADCAQLNAQRGTEVTDVASEDQSGELPFDVDAIDADPTKMAFLSYGARIPDGEGGHFGQILAVQMGNRVLWAVEDVIGMDYNCGLAPDPDVEQCPIPRAAQSMAERAGG